MAKGIHTQRIYLETSALNALRADPYLDPMLEHMLDSRRVFAMSEAVVQELLATRRSEERREQLRQILARLLSRSVYLFDLPTVLQRSLYLYAEGMDREDAFQVPGWDRPMRQLISELERVSDERAAAFGDQNRIRGDWLRSTYVEARVLIQDSLGDSRPPRVGEYLRSISGNSDLIRDLRLPDLLKQRDRKLVRGFRNRSEEVIQSVVPWRVFFTALILNQYQATVARERFGLSKNPGFIDVEQLVYLPACSVFVLGDRRQERLARLVRKACGLDCVIERYERFRERMLIEML